MSIRKVKSARQRPKTRRPNPATQRPELTADEIALLESRFDAVRWDATVDADRAAEHAAAQKPAMPVLQPRKQPEHA